jgi:hypothetical protein
VTSYPPPGVGESWSDPIDPSIWDGPPVPPWASPPYPPPPYPQPPDGRATPAARMVSAPWLGGPLIAAGLLATLGSFLPWATLNLTDPPTTVNGSDADGTLTAFLAVLAALMGVLIALRKGWVWTSIVSLVASSVGALIALVDLLDATQGVAGGADLPDDVFSVGYGLWLVLSGCVAAMALSIAALAKRIDALPAH